MILKLVNFLFLAFSALVMSCHPYRGYLDEQSRQIEAQEIIISHQQLSIRAMQATLNEDYDTAIELLTRTIAQEANPTEKALAYQFRGRAYADSFRFDQALKDFDAALQLEPTQYRSRTERGRVYGALGKYDQAFEDFDAAIRLDEKKALAYRQRGEASLKQREYSRALVDFDKAIALSYAYPLAYMSRGWANFYMGHFSTAVADFARAVEQSKRDAEPAIWLYLARLLNGQDATAELQQNAQQRNLQKWLGAVVNYFLRATGREAIFEALKHPDPNIENDRRCKVYFYLGQYALAKSDRSEAVELLTAALETGMAHSVEYFGAREELERLK
jgi:lipoprotein NlpI